MKKKFTYLALGDSYTVGELVQLQKNFPYHAVQILRRKGFKFGAPEIVAKTGWTTRELFEGISNYVFTPPYHFVTLLIGVNNQYRGLPAEEYQQQFEELLKKAIEFAGKNNNGVITVSIPDYGATPVGQTLDAEKISSEIDLFNDISKEVSEKHRVHYIDITPGSKEAKNDPELVASDKLHPSEKEYKKWAELVAEKIESLLQS